MKYKITNKDSINAVLSQMKPYDELELAPGLYNEKVVVNTPNIKIYGLDKEKTIVSYDDYYLRTMKDHAECNTFRTYTMQVNSNNVTLENFTIENRAIPSTKYGQAVALYVSGDNFIAKDMIIKSEQDTLFTAPLPKDLQERYIGFLPDKVRTSGPSRQKYLHCDIFGDVDFIFGGATALFKDCNIHCLNKRGYVAAPSHDESLKYGYLFKNCNIIGSHDQDVDYYLARPWRDYAKVAFIDCKYDLKLNEKVFSKWNDTTRHQTSCFLEYSEYSFPNMNDFAKKMTKEEAIQFESDFMKYIGE